MSPRADVDPVDLVDVSEPDQQEEVLLRLRRGQPGPALQCVGGDVLPGAEQLGDLGLADRRTVDLGDDDPGALEVGLDPRPGQLAQPVDLAEPAAADRVELALACLDEQIGLAAEVAVDRRCRHVGSTSDVGQRCPLVAELDARVGRGLEQPLARRGPVPVDLGRSADAARAVGSVVAMTELRL